MTTDLDRLRAALAGRYTVSSVLGEGGMATVYRATDLKHRREVAIKVLFSDLSQAIGSERFLHEIEIAAGLQHPRILALYDSGEVDGFLYYVMPLVEGESLSDRLNREKQLPISDAIRIAREVASALAYAHSRGIVHRDIKPANIMLSGGEAVVADFGIALALKAAGGERLTMTGISIGTPAYMSPEQASGESVDARSDVYSLGCVLYEMLAGMPPYSGPTVESVVRQHVAAPVPRISVVRPTVSAGLETTIERALAKVPADRIPSATQFLAALEAPESVLASRAMRVKHIAVSRRAIIGAAAAVVVSLAALGAWVLLKRANQPPPDEELIAVLPFEVSGDSSAAFLREGMVDLLTTQLGAIRGSRPLDSRTVLTAWRRAVREGEEPSTREARQLAVSLGSGRFVLGNIIGTGTELSITASIFDVDGDQPIAGNVRGPRDSLFSLVDQLTSQLIAGSLGEPGRRLAELTSASLPAVRAYLDGRAALRGGALERAKQKFTEALELDSTFALAALGMASAGVWSQQAGQSAALRRGLLTGYALRERLSRRDQLLFEAWVLPSTSTVTAQDQLVGWQRAAEAASESPEALYEHADRLYHSGEQLGIVDATVRAESSFAKALALDSTFVPPLAHLVEIAVRSGDRRTVRQLASLYGVESNTADAGDYVRWRVALVLGDQRTLDAVRSRLGTMPQASLNRIIGFGLTDGAEMADIDGAAAELRRRVDAGTVAPGNVHPGQSLHSWALNRGRRGEVPRAIAAIEADEPLVAGSSIVFFGADQVPVLDALFWDGDSVTAADAVTRIEQRLSQARAGDSGERARQYTNLCVAALWRQTQGQAALAQTMIGRLRVGAAMRDAAAIHGADPTLCLTLLDAMIATASAATDAGALVARLDSLLESGPYVFGSDWGNLALARLYEARGDRESALRVVRRRPDDWDTGPLDLSTYLREEGRLAALTGHRAGAARAYERFLALRSGADASFQTHTVRVRNALSLLR